MREDRNVTVSPGMAWVAGLPILGCMLVMGLPSLADPKVLAFRLFYTLAYLAWIVPLGWLQRVLWRRGANAWTMAAWLLPASYAMSVANAMFALEFIASPAMRARADWTWVFGGLDGCWLALIAFCGVQAVVLHRAELRADGERLRVDIHTAPGTLDALVPYLLLQPLVENAIRHGIAPRAEGGRIGIRFERESTTLRVVVDNDRVGTTATVAGQGVGLANVRARLEALHPAEYRLDVGPHEDLWRVTVTLPWRAATTEATT